MHFINHLLFFSLIIFIALPLSAKDSDNSVYGDLTDLTYDLLSQAKLANGARIAVIPFSTTEPNEGRGIAEFLVTILGTKSWYCSRRPTRFPESLKGAGTVSFRSNR